MCRLVLCAVAALALSACTVGPDFVPPPVVAPDSFGPEPRHVRSRTTDAEPDPQWWRCFRDPELASLEERLAAQNLDLKTAAERVAQAGAERVIVASQGLPHLDVQSVDNYQRISPNGLPSALVVPAPGAPKPSESFKRWGSSACGTSKAGSSPGRRTSILPFLNTDGQNLHAPRDRRAPPEG